MLKMSTAELCIALVERGLGLLVKRKRCLGDLLELWARRRIVVAPDSKVELASAFACRSVEGAEAKEECQVDFD